MHRVISYMDGLNLHYGMRDSGFHRYFWLDPAALTKTFLRPGQQFAHCHYFTTRVARSTENQATRHQNLWLDALESVEGISCHFGHYLSKPRKCPQCNTTWHIYEEKMTDVNIATQLLVDTYEDRYDTAIIVSGDSDLITPIKRIRKHFPEKRLIIAFPPDRDSKQLKQISGFFHIGADKLKRSLLPDQITTASGFVLKRPDDWR